MFDRYFIQVFIRSKTFLFDDILYFISITCHLSTSYGMPKDSEKCRKWNEMKGESFSVSSRRTVRRLSTLQQQQQQQADDNVVTWSHQSSRRYSSAIPFISKQLVELIIYQDDLL